MVEKFSFFVNFEVEKFFFADPFDSLTVRILNHKHLSQISKVLYLQQDHHHYLTESWSSFGFQKVVVFVGCCLFRTLFWQLMIIFFCWWIFFYSMEVSSVYLLTIKWILQFERCWQIVVVFWMMRLNNWWIWQFFIDWLHNLPYFSFCWLDIVENLHTQNDLQVNHHRHFLFPKYFVVCHKWSNLIFEYWTYYLVFFPSKDWIGFRSHCLN